METQAMVDIRKVSDMFSVAPQIRPEDMPDIAALGFRLVINNRPDGESPDQPSGAEVASATRAEGLEYLHVPVTGRATPAQVKAVHDATKASAGPVLAFCRSGTRSINTWAIGQAQSGERTPRQLIALGGEAGYDLSGLAG